MDSETVGLQEPEELGDVFEIDVFLCDGQHVVRNQKGVYASSNILQLRTLLLRPDCVLIVGYFLNKSLEFPFANTAP